MQSLDFRLPVFPDETLYSLITRYHYLLGNRKWRDTIELLCNTPAVLVHRFFPPFLNELNTALFPEPNISYVIDQLTIFPYFRPFLPERVVKRAIAHLATGHSMGGIKTLLGIVASQIGANTQLRFCHSCKDCDLAKYGQAYWHRIHQLPGVWICSIHKTALFEVNMQWMEARRRRLVLPDNLELLDHSALLPVDPAQLELLAHLARLSAHIQRANLGVISPLFWQELYLQQAQKLGLTWPSGRLCLRPLHVYLQSSLSQLPTQREFKTCVIPSTNLPSWILTLFRKPRHTYHPLKHLILATGLGLDYEVADLGKTQIKETAPPELSKQQNTDKESDEVLRQILTKSSGSLRQAAKATGISVTTLRLDAARLGISVQTKPKKLIPSIINALKQDFLIGLPLYEISAKEGVSIPTLYRVLRMFPGVAEKWRALQESQELEKRRKRFLTNKKRTIRDKQDYIWLYRHDRAWLQQQVKARVHPISKRARRVDWDARDKLLAARITEWFALEIQANKRPMRITISSIGKSLHVAAWLDFYLEKLPLTKTTIKPLLEKPEQFQLRRLAWAHRELNAKGLPIVQWRLIKMASIRPPSSRVVQEYIQTICQ